MNEKSLLGFQVLPIKFTEFSKTHHELFIKEHSVRSESSLKPKGRTLFVLNIPPWATKTRLKDEFNKIAPVSNIIIQDKPSTQNEDSKIKKQDKFFSKKMTAGFHVGYIVFKKPADLLKVLNCDTQLIISRYNKPVFVGVQKWINDYYESLPKRDELEQNINLFMKRYDKEELKRKQNEKMDETDEDGWITVKKTGRKPGLERKESVSNRIRNKRNKQLKNFYTFQIRESKMKHLASLREKFAEDKKKIESMRTARKFKPF